MEIAELKEKLRKIEADVAIKQKELDNAIAELKELGIDPHRVSEYRKKLRKQINDFLDEEKTLEDEINKDLEELEDDA